MPIYPDYRVPVEQVEPMYGRRVAPSPFAYHTFNQLSRDAEEISVIFGKLQQATDASEAGRLQRETSAAMQEAVKQSATQYSDPNEFEIKANQAVQDVYQERLRSASNDKVRQALVDSLGDDLILRRTDVTVLKHGKMRDKAVANWTALKDDAIKQYNSTDDPIEREKILGSVGSTLKSLADANLMDPSVKQKELEGLQEVFTMADIFRDFKKDPVQTLKDLDSNKYKKKLGPKELEAVYTHLSSQYRIAQSELRQKVKDQQEKNFADAMVRARKPGGITADQINELSTKENEDGSRSIDAQQARTLLDQMAATESSKGVLYSNPDVLSMYMYRLHRGRLTPEEVRTSQINGELTIGHANLLYNGIEARLARDRAEAREARIEAKLNDVSQSLPYKRAEHYIGRSLPNADRLDLSHSFRMMIGDAFVDFDEAVRSTDEDGKPKYKAGDYQKLAESIVDSTLMKMDLSQNSARSKLKPGIKSMDDIAAAVRAKRLTPKEAREQAEYLLILGYGASTSAGPIQDSSVEANRTRDDEAKARARKGGAP